MMRSGKAAPGISELAARLPGEFASTTEWPPVHEWNPPLSGDIDIRIARDGRWFHEGQEILRETLVRLFASILKREEDDYFLVTPVEKWRITVEDVPFYLVTLDVVCDDNEQVLVFGSTTGDKVAAGSEHPIRVEQNDASGEPIPYLLVRNSMWGRLSRSVYYSLAELAEPSTTNRDIFEVASNGVRFTLV